MWHNFLYNFLYEMWFYARYSIHRPLILYLLVSFCVDVVRSYFCIFISISESVHFTITSTIWSVINWLNTNSKSPIFFLVFFPQAKRTLCITAALFDVRFFLVAQTWRDWQLFVTLENDKIFRSRGVYDSSTSSIKARETSS